MNVQGRNVALGLAGLLALGLTGAVLSGRIEIPAPRYTEATDYPEVIARSLEAEFASDPQFKGLKVLRGWGWRWGRYDAVIQIWGCPDHSTEERIIQVVRNIKGQQSKPRDIKLYFVDDATKPAPQGVANRTLVI